MDQSDSDSNGKKLDRRRVRRKQRLTITISAIPRRVPTEKWRASGRLVCLT